MGTPFLIDAATKQRLHRLRQLAELNPFNEKFFEDAARAGNDKDDPNSRTETHVLIMNDFTMELPFGYTVTFTIEALKTGRQRHLSMASPIAGRIPLPEAIQMVADELGFEQPMKEWTTYMEEFKPGHHAVNVVETIDV